MKKRGKMPFYHQTTRLKLIEKNRDVSIAMLSIHQRNSVDMGVCYEIRAIHKVVHNDSPDCKIMFANGGDRKEGNVPEEALCKELGIDLVFNVGGEKIESSSNLIKRAQEK